MVFNQAVTNEFLNQQNADEIIIATGSLPVIPRSIPGIMQENQVLANDVLSSKAIIQNQKVLVLGAGLVGVETAEMLAEQNNQVSVVDMLDKAAPLAPSKPRSMLLKHCEQLGIQFILESKVVEILEDGIVYERNQSQTTLQGFDKIV